MRFRRQLFESRVARRVFGLFVVASLLPLLGFSWLATNRVGAALERQAFERLGTLSRSYGQITLDKLVSVSEALGDHGSLERHTRDLPGVDAVSVVTGGKERVLRGDWPGSRAAIEIASDKPTLAVLPTAAGGEVVIARSLDDTVVFGRVAPSFLERSNGLLDSGAEVCLFPNAEGTSFPFYCSEPMSAEALLSVAEHAHDVDGTERLTWESDGEVWLGARWQLFLPSRFAAEPWLVVVRVRRVSALGALATLQRVIPLTALLALALIVVLATSQIRRTLNPLSELLEGTRRIAAHDFKHPVQVDPRDEFGTLGTALNGMARQLDHQFTALRALAAIDRLILDAASLEPVLETVFERLEELIPGARHFALIVDPDEPHHGHFYSKQPGGSIAVERVVVRDDLHRWLAADTADRVTTRAELESLGMPLGETGSSANACFVAPMAAGTPAAGALIAAKVDGSPFRSSEPASLREFATRIAVAAAATKREAELFQRAHFDSLTGLPNRELLHDRLHQAVAQAQREERGLAVLFLDLDSFKVVNDTHGHQRGDELLRETALRLTKALRPGDTVARLGGDEYAILLPNVHGPLEAEAVAAKAIEALRRPFVIDNHQSFVSASIGIALFPGRRSHGRRAAP